MFCKYKLQALHLSNACPLRSEADILTTPLLFKAGAVTVWWGQEPRYMLRNALMLLFIVVIVPVWHLLLISSGKLKALLILFV